MTVNMVERGSLGPCGTSEQKMNDKDWDCVTQGNLGCSTIIIKGTNMFLHEVEQMNVNIASC